MGLGTGPRLTGRLICLLGPMGRPGPLMYGCRGPCFALGLGLVFESLRAQDPERPNTEERVSVTYLEEHGDVPLEEEASHASQVGCVPRWINRHTTGRGLSPDCSPGLDGGEEWGERGGGPGASALPAWVQAQLGLGLFASGPGPAPFLSPHQFLKIV